MKTYKFVLTVREGSDEFWEEVTKNGSSGCGEVYELVKGQLEAGGVFVVGNDPLFDDVTLKLVEFKDGDE